MPKSKKTGPSPRINVTISPAARAALERFSEVSGIAAAQFIRGIVDDSIPIIEAMTHAFEMAKKSPQRAGEMMQSELVRAMAQAAQAQLQLEEESKKRKLRRRPQRD